MNRPLRRASGGQTYQIQSGDNLSSLAKRFGVSVDDFLAVNPQIANKNMIRAGKTLTIPQSGAANRVGGDLPPPPLPQKKPDAPGGGRSAMPVMYQSEYDQAIKNNPKMVPNAVVLPDPPPPPTIKSEPPVHAPGFTDDELAEMQNRPQDSPWDRIHEMIDPTRVLNNTDSPDISDRLRTALAGMGPEAPAAEQRIAQPMAGTARDAGDNTVSAGVTPRSLLNNRFTQMNPDATGGQRIGPDPAMGRPPRTPVTVDPATGRFRAGRSTELPVDSSNFGPGIRQRTPNLDDVEPVEMSPFARKTGGNVQGYAIGGNPSAFVERAASYGLRHEGFLNSGIAGRTDHIGLQVRNGSYVIPADVVSAAGQGNSLAGAKAFDSLLKQGPYGTAIGGIKAPRTSMPMGGSMKMSTKSMMPGIGRGGGSMRMSGIPGIATGGNVTDMPKNTTDVPKNVPPPNNTWGPGPWQHLDEAAKGGAVKKPRELVAPKEGKWKGYSEGGPRVAGSHHRIPILAAGGEYIVAPETVAKIGNGDPQKGFRILDKLVLKTRRKHIKTLQNLKPPKQR